MQISPPRERSLGKKQANLLAAIMRGVPILGCGKEPHVLTDCDVRSVLETLAPGDDAQRTGELNRARPRLLNAIIGAGARRTGYLSGLPRHGVEPLLRTVSEAVRGPLVLRVVYGASTHMPLRALSYVLPALRMAARLTAAGQRTPYLKIVLASPLSSRVNVLPEPVTAAETDLLTHCLDRLLAALAPGRYGLYRTRPSAEILGTLDDLVRTLTPARRTAVLNRLGGKGGATTDEQTLLYAAAHVLLHDRTGAIPLNLEYGTHAPQHARVIDIGSLEERHFHHARRLFASSAADDTSPSALVLSRHSVPPYTMARGGDIGLREFLDGTSPQGGPLAPAVRHDLRLQWTDFPSDELRDVLAGRREALP
ncbi:hypothetical protein [Streptomyces sp. NPDC005799]|uniref:hypothetical protein n=1 Tax=Streptomyces sp. NPDC005799 TaxID=3154678 RepID=UPI0033C73DED